MKITKAEITVDVVDERIKGVILTNIESLCDVARWCQREVVLVLVGNEFADAAGHAVRDGQPFGQAGDVADSSKEDGLAECYARE